MLTDRARRMLLERRATVDDIPDIHTSIHPSTHPYIHTYIHTSSNNELLFSRRATFDIKLFGHRSYHFDTQPRARWFATAVRTTAAAAAAAAAATTTTRATTPTSFTAVSNIGSSSRAGSSVFISQWSRSAHCVSDLRHVEVGTAVWAPCSQLDVTGEEPRAVQTGRGATNIQPNFARCARNSNMR